MSQIRNDRRSSTEALVSRPELLFKEGAVREAVTRVADAVVAQAPAGKPVSARSADAFVRKMEKDLTFEKLNSVRWWYDGHAKSFSPEAQAQLTRFLEVDGPREAKADPVTGIEQSLIPGEPTFSPEMAQRYGAGAKIVWGDDDTGLVHGRMTPQQIQQSGIGDCYFLSAMNALNARRPSFVKNLIHQDGHKVWTTFYAKGLHESRFTPVKVESDDLVPLNDGVLLGAKSADLKEDWPAVYEKLWAKFRGGYDNIEGGLTTDVLAAMTGHVPKMKQVFQDSDPAEVLRYIQGRLDAGDAVSCDTYGSDGKGVEDPLTDYSGTGLPMDHCMAVLGTEVRDGKTFIRIQNPWGMQPQGKKDPFAADPAKYPDPVTVRPSDMGAFDISPENFVRWFANVGSVALPAAS